MQTFLPNPSFYSTAAILDNKRLGKQRVEAFQILKALKDPNYGWQNHPAVNMWRGYEDALTAYYNTMLEGFAVRGFKNNKLQPIKYNLNFIHPPWLVYEPFSESHKSNLLRKNPDWYKQFNWHSVPLDLEYYWPSKSSVTSCITRLVPIGIFPQCTICRKIMYTDEGMYYAVELDDMYHFTCSAKCKQIFALTPIRR